MNTYVGNGKWNTPTRLAFWGGTIQAIFNFIGLSLGMYLAYNLTDILLGGILPSVTSMSLDYYEERFRGFLGGAVICFALAFLGYLIYLIGICLFTGAQRSRDSARKTRNIMLAELIMPTVTIILAIILYTDPDILSLAFDSPTAFLVTICILALAAVIIPLVEFKRLTKEDTWSEKARKGADDLKFSYSCILWILVIFIFALGLAALVTYASITKLHAIGSSGYDKYGNAIQGMASAAQQAQNLVATIKVIMMFACIFAFIFLLLHTIYRIGGWNKIWRGGNEVVHQFTPKGQAPTKTGSDDSAESGEAEAPSKTSSGITIVYEDQQTDNRKKWMLWGGIAAGIIAVAAGLWALWGHSGKIEPDANVFADRSIVFKSVEDGVGIQPLAELAYGDAVETKPSEYDADGIWTKVSFEKDGKVTEGYMAKADLLNPKDLSILNRAGMTDSGLRSGMPHNIERLALLSALKSSEGNWSIEKLESYGQTRPNSTRLTVRGASPSEDCLGFILINDDEPDRKMFFLYSTPDIHRSGNISNPTYLYNEPVGDDKYAAYDVIYNRKNDSYAVDYTRRYYKDDPEDFLYEGSAIDEEDEQAERQFDGLLDMEGLIDGKYPVKMEITLHADGSVSGTITYLKYNVPMGLAGTFTGSGESRDLSLEERDDDKVTGNFIGRYDGRVFSGSWVSADGAKEMPFRVER